MESVKIVFNLLLALFLAQISSTVQLNPGYTRRCSYGRPTVKYQNEVYTFLVTSNMSVWQKLRWDKITTLALFMEPDHDLVCLAHKHNVKVVTKVDFSGKILSNATDRKQVVTKTLELALKYNLDGANVDFEEPIKKGSPKREYLTLMVEELSTAFHSAINGSQISVDLPYDPDGIYGRWFDAFGIAFACDFIVAMDYDLENFVVAISNSGYHQVLKGAQRYLAIGIPRSKLVLAMPWYGYKFNCLNITKDHVCKVKDRQGVEIGYSTILEYYFINFATSEELWDDQGLSPFFDMNIKGVLAQMRYDNPRSLKLKYNISVSLGLLGVGMWTANELDYSDSKEGRREQAEMWGAIPYNRTIRHH